MLTTYFLSLCVMIPFSSFSAIAPRTFSASLAKSKSRTSPGLTGMIAKASLSSRTGAVPTCRFVVKKCSDVDQTRIQHMKIKTNYRHQQPEKMDIHKHSHILQRKIYTNSVRIERFCVTDTHSVLFILSTLY